MQRRSHYHQVVLILLGGVLISVSACSTQAPSADVPTAEAIRGKVTYDGKAVPFGYVLFYSLDKGFDPKAKGFKPNGFTRIGEDGSYEARGVPIGPCRVCVVTDPDVDPATAFGPRSLGEGKSARGEDPGAPPPGGPSGGPAGRRPKGPPGGAAGGLPKGPPGDAAGGPPKGPPGDAPDGPPKGSGGPAGGPPPHGPGSRRANPRLEKLKPEDIQMLKDINVMYGTFGASPLACVARPGEQTFDLELKSIRNDKVDPPKQ